MLKPLIAIAALAFACGGDDIVIPVPETVIRAGLDAECVEALLASPALAACTEFCDSCKLEEFESCRDRCATAEVIADAATLEAARACWRGVTMCVLSDLAHCDVAEDWVDFDRAIPECADDFD